MKKYLQVLSLISIFIWPFKEPLPPEVQDNKAAPIYNLPVDRYLRLDPDRILLPFPWTLTPEGEQQLQQWKQQFDTQQKNILEQMQKNYLYKCPTCM